MAEWPREVPRELRIVKVSFKQISMINTSGSTKTSWIDVSEELHRRIYGGISV